MERPYAVGVDIGGTNTVFGIVDRRGDIVRRGGFSTKAFENKPLEEYIDKFVESLNDLIDQVDGAKNIKGIGVGAPNGNYYTGCIEFAPNLPWKGVIPLAQILTDRLNIPAALTNDANAAAVGEMTYGVARGIKDFIVITLGTGVGSGIVVNGQLVYGHDGFAGELGHTTIIKDGRVCGCGKKGCLETYSSATGVARTAREYLERNNDPSILRSFNPEEITSKHVHDAALQGDVMAKEIFEYTGRLLGEAFADFVAFSSPEAIILFGGLTKSGRYIYNPIRKHMEQNLLPIFRNKIRILFSDLKDADAAILGSSALAWELP